MTTVMQATMQKPATPLQTAGSVFEAWNALGFNARAHALVQAAQSLPEQPQKMALWQLANAQKKLAQTQTMPGPTGELNELSNLGRGCFLCLSLIDPSPIGQSPIDHSTEPSAIGLAGQIFTALVTGNPVITAGQVGQILMEAIAPFVAQGVIQHIADSELDATIEASPLAGIALLCDDAAAVNAFNMRLAAKDGLIAQLVAETNSATLSTIAQPHYALRFVTERTVSINTTAIGGNATLLELGSLNEE